MNTNLLLLTENEESEAAKQAKLKGYRSIGFGRWVDRSGNLVALTNKKGRLVPYQHTDIKVDEPTHEPASDYHGAPEAPKQTTSFITPFIRGHNNQPAHVNNRSAAISPISVDNLKNKFDLFAEKYAAKALLILLKWISAKELTEQEMRFYTGPAFTAYAPIMKDAVFALQLALMELETSESTIKKFDLDILYQYTTLKTPILHILLVDMANHGPSYIYAKSMLLKYSEQADQYNEHDKILTFDYSKVEHIEKIDGELDTDHHYGEEHEATD